MLKLNENYKADRRFLRCENIRYSIIKNPNSQIYQYT